MLQAVAEVKEVACETASLEQGPAAVDQVACETASLEQGPAAVDQVACETASLEQGPAAVDQGTNEKGIAGDDKQQNKPKEPEDGEDSEDASTIPLGFSPNESCENSTNKFDKWYHKRLFRLGRALRTLIFMMFRVAPG